MTLHSHIRFVTFCLLNSIVVSIPACHAGDQGSIPCWGAFFIVVSIPACHAGDQEEIVVPITRVQVQQLQFAVQSGQVEMLALSAQFLAHYADVIPQNSLVGSEVLDCTLALMELDHLEVLIPASSALSVFCSNGDESVREILAKKGTIRLAVKLLRSPSNPVAINALAILTCYAGHSDRFRESIVRDGALNPLCDLAHSEDNRIQKGAAGAILNVSHADGHCQHLLMCGVSDSLHRFLTSRDTHLQFYAAATISNLAVQTEDPSVLVTDEGLTCLVLLLQENERLIQQSCIALRNLASQAAMQERVSRCGALEPLYPLLRHHDPNIQTAALSLLHNLSILCENEERIIQMGYVPEEYFIRSTLFHALKVRFLLLLTRVLLLQENERLIQQSCIALRNLASQAAMQVRILIYNLLNSYIYQSFIFTGPRFTGMLGVSSPERVSRCGALEPLYPLLRHHDPNIQTAALSLLHNLSILCENEERIIQMGYVPEQTQVHCTESIGARTAVRSLQADRYSTNNSQTTYIPKHVFCSFFIYICHVMPGMCLVMKLPHHASAPVGASTCWNLSEKRPKDWNFMTIYGSTCYTVVVKHVRMCSQTVTESGGERGREREESTGLSKMKTIPSYAIYLFLLPPPPAAATISNLAVQTEDPSVLVTDEGLTCLVLLLQENERLIQQSCIALRNLASQAAMQERVSRCGALEPLYPLLRHHDPNIQTAALSLLHNLSILCENEERIIQMGYVPELTLVVLSVVNNPKTILPVLYEVTAVLAVLSRDMEAQNRLVTQQSAVSNMVQLFAAYIKARQDLKLVFYTLGVIGGFSSNSVLRDLVVRGTDIVSQITHYITPDTPADLIKVVLWTTDLLYAHPTINGGVKSEMLASVTHLKAHASDTDVIGACEDLLAPS
eukprot:sb/3461859/